MFVVLVPVKPPAVGKSRLSELGDRERRELAAAFALDTVEACRHATLVGQVLVITDDAGFAAELAGVATGRPFGHYGYTERLGPKVRDVPVLAAAAWALLARPSWVVGGLLTRRRAPRVALAAGAREIVLVADHEQALALKRNDPSLFLTGEIGGRPIPGFDVGNSPSAIERRDLSCGSRAPSR